MKHTRKWMVVPFDEKYFKQHQSSHHILKNKILPSDVKTKLFNELLTKLLLKQNPEKQLPIDSSNSNVGFQDSKNLENNYKNIVQNLENKIKNESKDESENNNEDDLISLNELFREPKKESSNSEDMMDIDEDTLIRAKKKEIPKRLKAKRLLEQSMNQSVIIPKKNRKKSNEFQFNLEDAPAQNTRNQTIQYKLNTAQLGNGWLRYK